MFQVQKTDEFDRWLAALRDQRAVAKIASRIERLAMGNAGDVKAVGAGVSELRVDYGPGYRVYYKQVGNRIHFDPLRRRQVNPGSGHQPCQSDRSEALSRVRR